MNYIASLIMMTVYNLAIIFGTGYVVFWMGFSGWWFLLAAVFVVSTKNTP